MDKKGLRELDKEIPYLLRTFPAERFCRKKLGT